MEAVGDMHKIKKEEGTFWLKNTGGRGRKKETNGKDAGDKTQTDRPTFR